MSEVEQMVDKMVEQADFDQVDFGLLVHRRRRALPGQLGHDQSYRVPPSDVDRVREAFTDAQVWFRESGPVFTVPWPHSIGAMGILTRLDIDWEDIDTNDIREQADFDQVDFGKPKREWEKQLDALQQDPGDARGSWLRKKTLDTHGLDHGWLYHFKIPKQGSLPEYDVYVAFDTFCLDVIWVEEGSDVVYFSKYDYSKLQDDNPEDYQSGDLRQLATLVIGEQDIWDEYEDEAEELQSDPLEYVPHTTKLVEV